MLFVQLVDIDLASGLFVAHLHHIGAQTVFLAATDKPLHLFGREPLVVDIVLLAQAFDGAQLVLRIQYLKGLGQIGQLVVGPQEAIAQTVEGAYPHTAHVHRQHGAKARHHFLGCLVGEGNRQNTA